MALTMRPDFPAVEGNTTRGDFVIAWDDRLKVLVLGDCRTHHMAWLPSGDYERALEIADRAKREGLALVDDWLFDTFKPCAECGRPIDERSTICRSCARLRGVFDSDRAREAGRRSAAKRWGNRNGTSATEYTTAYTIKLTGYTIKLTGTSFPEFLRKNETTLSAYTRYLEEAKVFKTYAGAERWIAERPDFGGRVVAVKMVKTLRGRMVPQAV